MEKYICLSCEDPSLVFVYGANESYINGAGAAKHAVLFHGAKNYIGPLCGNSYGIPTKDRNIKTLSLEEVKKHVDIFLEFARLNTEKRFFLTKIGCGLAGFKESQIGPLFEGAPQNCILPEGWG